MNVLNMYFVLKPYFFKGSKLIPQMYIIYFYNNTMYMLISYVCNYTYVTLYQSLSKYSVFLFAEFVCWMPQIKLMNFRRFFAAAHVGFGDFVGRVRSIRDADQRETYDENGVPASEINSR